MLNLVSLLVLLAVVSFLLSSGRPAFFECLLIAVVVGAMLWLACDRVFSRAEVTPDSLLLVGLYPRKSLRTPLKAVHRYRMDDMGNWWVETIARKIKVPLGKPWTLHAAIVELWPRCLNAKRLRTHRSPSGEEFRNLRTFDLMPPIMGLAGWLCGAFIWFMGDPSKWASSGLSSTGGYLMGLIVALGCRSWGRLDVTREGLGYRNLFDRRFIPWSEATAIFREGTKGDRRFVVTGRSVGIEIPSHLARELPIMEAVLYALPDGILCVNFDETTFRGYRRRKVKELSLPLPELQPSF